jgi:hypothetical protein
VIADREGGLYGEGAPATREGEDAVDGGGDGRVWIGSGLVRDQTVQAGLIEGAQDPDQVHGQVRVQVQVRVQAQCFWDGLDLSWRCWRVGWRGGKDVGLRQ